MNNEPTAPKLPSLPSLENLQQRLDAAKPRREQEGMNAHDAGLGMRIAMELMASALVGGMIGWLLDHWLDTLPLFLIICFLLGFSGGLLNMKRAAERLDTGGQSATTPPTPDQPEEEDS